MFRSRERGDGSSAVFGNGRSIPAQRHSLREQVGMKQSSHMTGVVQDMILTFEHEGGEATAAVGSAAW
ncbi:MAG TPA: hypothetical protein VFA09_01510, partial [Ktedonobacteraceae bacterium]|nr:hypothetical protein [Ktedonobacteraceae bacterium]